MQRQLLLSLLLATAALAPDAAAQGRGSGTRPTGPLETHTVPSDAGIAWFGTWSGALGEAERTGRPILFMSAAPQCRNVPGVW